MKIAILDDYQDAVRHLDCFKLLAEHEVKIFTNTVRGIGQLAARLAPFEALVLIRERSALNKMLLNQLPALRLIAQTGKVSGHIDVAAATARKITIVEGVGNPIAPAELAWALIMAATRRIPQYTGMLKAGFWQQAASTPQHNLLGTTLNNKTLGIWGYGKIGRMIAQYGKAFGMDVVIWGRDPSLEQARQDGFRTANGKQSFFAEADVLSLHLRLNDATRGIVTLDDLLCMKSTACFVNTSRAELVVPHALETALNQQRPGMAALDVFENEPLPANSSLLQMENVVATPHLGYVEKSSYELYFSSAFDNINAYAAGTPKNVLNPEALAPS